MRIALGLVVLLLLSMIPAAAPAPTNSPAPCAGGTDVWLRSRGGSLCGDVRVDPGYAILLGMKPVCVQNDPTCAGAQGPQGPTGPKGSSGPAGPPGLTGAVGPRGEAVQSPRVSTLALAAKTWTGCSILGTLDVSTSGPGKLVVSSISQIRTSATKSGTARVFAAITTESTCREAAGVGISRLADADADLPVAGLLSMDLADAQTVHVSLAIWRAEGALVEFDGGLLVATFYPAGPPQLADSGLRVLSVTGFRGNSTDAGLWDMSIRTELAGGFGALDVTKFLISYSSWVNSQTYPFGNAALMLGSEPTRMFNATWLRGDGGGSFLMESGDMVEFHFNNANSATSTRVDLAILPNSLASVDASHTTPDDFGESYVIPLR